MARLSCRSDTQPSLVYCLAMPSEYTTGQLKFDVSVCLYRSLFQGNHVHESYAKAMLAGTDFGEVTTLMGKDYTQQLKGDIGVE